MKISKELIKGSSELLVLSALHDAPLYGYEIAKQIKEQSDNVFKMGEGTLYPILHKLEKQKLLSSYWQEVGGRKRKYYTLTKRGTKVLTEKSTEWSEFSAAVHNIITA